jgi:hypothetical protein
MYELITLVIQTHGSSSFLFYSTGFFFTNMSEKHKSTSHIAIPVKNKRKTIGIEEKLDVICQLEEGE